MPKSRFSHDVFGLTSEGRKLQITITWDAAPRTGARIVSLRYFVDGKPIKPMAAAKLSFGTGDRIGPLRIDGREVAPEQRLKRKDYARALGHIPIRRKKSKTPATSGDMYARRILAKLGAPLEGRRPAVGRRRWKEAIYAELYELRAKAIDDGVLEHHLMEIRKRFGITERRIRIWLKEFNQQC